MEAAVDSVAHHLMGRPLQVLAPSALPAKLRHKASSQADSSSPLRSSFLPASSVGYNASSSPARSSSVFRFSSPSGNNDLGHEQDEEEGRWSSRDPSSVLTSPPPSRSEAEDAKGSPSKSASSELIRNGSSVERRALQDIQQIDITLHDVQTFTLSPGQTIYVGRKLKPSTLLKSTISAASNTRFLRLPKAAKHASRHHCTIRLQELVGAGQEDGYDLVIDTHGQNGIQIDGQKTPKGIERLPVEDAQKITLGFYSGFEIVIRADVDDAMDVDMDPGLSRRLPLATEDKENAPVLKKEQAATTRSGVLRPRCHTPQPQLVRTNSIDKLVSSRCSSPLSVISSASLPNTPAGAIAHKRAKREGSVFSVRSRSQSAAPSPYAHQADDGYPPEEESNDEDEEDEDELAARLEAEAACQRVQQHVKTNQLDLIGCLASAMVFQPRAALTTTECIALLLESQPSFSKIGDIEAWRLSILRMLKSSDSPFDKIENSNLIKDASGKKLEPSWFYNPSKDRDTLRRANLEPFVKSLRATQRQKKQYYYKPISDLKRKRW